MKVITIGTLQGLFTSWNKDAVEELVKDREEVLVVNERENRICGKIKFIKCPKKFVAKKIYTIEGNSEGGDK